MSARGELIGRTVLVTGAARGIGAETARRLVALGANAMLVGLEPERLAALAAQLGELQADWVEADVTDERALSDAVEATVARFGGIDVAIANAGLHFVGGLATAPTRQLERELSVNLNGTLLTDRAVLPALVESRGYLLNIASLSASAHLPLMGAYSASKAGVEALTNCLRAEIAYTGVDVGCAYLGFFDTDLVRQSYAHPSSAPLLGALPAAMTRPRPLSAAVEAIVDAVEHRKARAWAPRYVAGALALRGVLQPVADTWARRSRAVAAAAEIAAREPEAESDSRALLGVAATVEDLEAGAAPARSADGHAASEEEAATASTTIA